MAAPIPAIESDAVRIARVDAEVEAVEMAGSSEGRVTHPSLDSAPEPGLSTVGG